MIIKKIELEKFKPLMHCGNTGISIDVLSQICVLIGNNGSGKSTILGEITPLPAISSKYEVGGYKKIVIEHNGYEYIATSRFSKKGGTHSLRKNGVELNTSGNAPMQVDLCSDEFGLTNIVKTIITGDVSMCSLSRVQRKQLLLACYPSDLTFVLNHHKRILREMKDTQANVKMLVERKAELESKLLTPDVLEKKQELIDALKGRYDTARKLIDKTRYELKHIEEDEFFNSSGTGFKFDGFSDKLIRIGKTIMHHRNTSPKLFSEDPNILLSSLIEKHKHLVAKKEDLSIKLHEALKEMELLESTDSDELDEKITSITDRIASIRKLISKHECGINTSIGMASISDIEIRDSIIEKITSISNIHLLSVEELNAKRMEWNALKERERNLEKREKEIIQRLSSINRQMAADKQQAFRKGCTLACPARENHTTIITLLEQDKEEAESIIDELNEAKIQIIKRLAEINDVITEMEPYVGILKQLFRDLDATGTVEVLDNKPLSKMINENAGHLISSISIMFDNRAHQTQLDSLTTELVSLEKRLVDLTNAKRKVDGISNTQKTKAKSTLIDIDNQLNIVGGDIVITEKSISTLKELVGLHSTVSSMTQQLQHDGSAVLLAEKHSILEERTFMLDDYLKKVGSMIFNEEQQMKSIDAISIRMNQEILPELDKREKDLINLSALEKALSPATGLPHKYMVEFINTIFGMVNHTIRCVWNYSMELVPLDDAATLTFDFPIAIHDHGRLKDISILSKGQKEIVDLAFTLALYMAKDLSGKFPLKLDEVDSGMSEHHRTQLLVLFKELLDSGEVEQMFLVNHHNQMFTAFTDAQIVCLQSDGIILPEEYNSGVDIH